VTETASETAERRAPGARRSRRPLPALIFLLVLALAALAVWWNVLGDERRAEQAEAAACSSAENAPTEVDPTTVVLRVLNDSDLGGKASEVAAQLQAVGFTVEEIGNDLSEIETAGVGELRFGPRGQEIADYLRLYLPGATDRPDSRADAKVDLVIGPAFTGLASSEAVAAALAPAESAAAAC
jgi:LytR cell envelope-related transcriptional attenuator